MSKFVINNIQSLNLLLDRVKSGDPASYEYINSYFQAFLDNDNYLMKQIKEQIKELRTELESGEIVIPGTGTGSGTGETGIGALGIPTFLSDTEPDVDASVDYIWFKPIRKSSTIIPDEPDVPGDEDPIVTFVLEATEGEDGDWHIKIDDIVKAIENATSNPNEAEEGEYVITPVESENPTE